MAKEKLKVNDDSVVSHFPFTLPSCQKGSEDRRRETVGFFSSMQEAPGSIHLFVDERRTSYVHLWRKTVPKEEKVRNSRRVHLMEPTRDVRESAYELRIGVGFAHYVDSDGEVRMTYTGDGVYFSGKDSSFERLYKLLSSRPELCVARDPSHVSLITEGVNYTQEDAEPFAHVAQIIEWLGIAPPNML